MAYDVVGIGNALVDIQTRLGDERLEELGYAKGLMTLSEADAQQILLEALAAHEFETCSGGSAANTLHGVGTLGGKAYSIGRVADDEFGRLYADDMAAAGIGFPGPRPADVATGTSVVLITPDAQRTMVTHLGVSTALEPGDVDTSAVQGARYAYLEGYLWTGDDTREAALRLARAARAEGAEVAFTLSDGFIIDGFRNSLVPFLREHADILFCNEVEALAMAETDDPAEAFERLLEMCPTVFVTRGEHGAWGGVRGEEKVSVEGYRVDAVDTTGAGDLFAAGALTGLLRGKSIRESMILGCYAAAQVITQLGARLPAGRDHDVEQILASYTP